MAKGKSRVPAGRREQILTWLEEEGSLSIRELENRLEVSHMTVHRDLDRLAGQHLVKKVRGGVILFPAGSAQQARRQSCAMCGGRIPVRSEFVILRREESQLNGCCPHCGILLLSEKIEAESVLARDYLYGRMVNIFQAFFVVESDVRLCCVPSIICFANELEAEKFQHGFGGQVMDFSHVLFHLANTHQHNHS